MDKIYVIRPINGFKTFKEYGRFSMDYKSNWEYGFASSFEEAEDIVVNNVGDVHESFYDNVVITEHDFTACNSAITKETFYEYAEGGFKKILEFDLMNDRKAPEVFGGYRFKYHNAG